MSPVVQFVIELLVMTVMVSWRVIAWMSSCLDPSQVSASKTPESGVDGQAPVQEASTKDTGCRRHDCQVLRSILSLSRESNSLLRVLVSLRRSDPLEVGLEDIGDNGDTEASDEEEPWLAWVSVISFPTDKTDRKKFAYIFAIFSSFRKSETRTEIPRLNNKQDEFNVCLAKLTHI